MGQELQIAFGGYSEEEIKDILAALRTTKYQVNRFYKVSLTEISEVLKLTIELGSGVFLLAFLISFAKELGKNLAQKIFPPSNKNKPLYLIVQNKKIIENSSSELCKKVTDLIAKMRDRNA